MNLNATQMPELRLAIYILLKFHKIGVNGEIKP